MKKYGIKKAVYYLSYHVLPSLFWISLIFGFDTPYVSVLTILSALFHEIGHLAALHYTGAKFKAPRGALSGFRIKKADLLSYRDEILILAAGPLSNVIISVATLPFLSLCDEYINMFFIINLSTALSNLLPAEGYDGYGILYQIFEFFGLPTQPLEEISFLISVAFTFFSLYLVGRYSAGYWIFGVFFASMASKISKKIQFGDF